jgi:flagellar biosynthesis regulator FlaF
MTDEMQPPKLEEKAPGLVWRYRKSTKEWIATWQARSDIVKKGYARRSWPLWTGNVPTKKEADQIVTQCQHFQFEMLAWHKNLSPSPAQAPDPSAFDGSLKSLVHCYRKDPDSPYQKNRYHVRQNRDSLLRRIVARHGDKALSEIKARILLAWHKEWSLDGERLATGSAFIGQLRALFSFGATLLEDAECERLCSVMHKMRFPGTKARSVSITAEQADMIRMAAHAHRLPSIALAQAFQFECTLRQKDVIGEWVPLSEEGMSGVLLKNKKWLRGIVWQEIDENLVLRHVTSKKQKLMEADLKLAPMVMEELQKLTGGVPLVVVDHATKSVTVNRHLLQASGPVIKHKDWPWNASEYRRKWRRLAKSCGIPDNVWNMDSRSGAISEAIQAGAPIEFVRHAATHSDVSQTADYDRGQAEATAKVMKMRMESRNKPKTE